jgi:hypothetical protein
MSRHELMSGVVSAADSDPHQRDAGQQSQCGGVATGRILPRRREVYLHLEGSLAPAFSYFDCGPNTTDSDRGNQNDRSRIDCRC